MNALINGSDNHICIICYSNDDHTLKCADTYCNTRICEGCFESYLNVCLEQKSLVKCLDQHCKSYFISDCFSKKNTYFDMYKKVLMTAFLASQGSEVRDSINVSKMVSNLRDSKEQYVKTFPPAIQLVIDVALSKKLKTIKKQNRAIIETVIKTSNRLCMNSHCNGKLDDNFECIKCSTRFCKECEKIKKSGHVCNSTDVDSLKLMLSFTKCPNCNIVIERSEGCRNMTCSSCHTNFDYHTGEIGGSGSSNMAIGPPKEKFFFDFKQNYSETVSALLYDIESYIPADPCIKSLNNAIKKMMMFKENAWNEASGGEGGDVVMSGESGSGDSNKNYTDKLKNSEEFIAIENNTQQTFEKYLKSKIKYSNFINFTVQITDLHHKNCLTSYDLEEILRKIKKL